MTDKDLIDQLSQKEQEIAVLKDKIEAAREFISMLPMHTDDDTALHFVQLAENKLQST